MSLYHQIRRLHQRSGYYTGGVPTEQAPVGDTVETHERDNTRQAVPSFPSDTDAIGVDAIYVTRSGRDVPTPGGTRAWAT